MGMRRTGRYHSGNKCTRLYTLSPNINSVTTSTSTSHTPTFVVKAYSYASPLSIIDHYATRYHTRASVSLCYSYSSR